MRTVRIRTTPGRDPGQHVGLVGLSCRRPGDLRSTLHTVTYYDRTGLVRREFAGPVLPGPYAFLTPHIERVELDLVSVEHVTLGAYVDVGLDRFVLAEAGPELVLEPVEHDPLKSAGATSGLELSVARSARGDFTMGGISRFADVLTLVGFLLVDAGMPMRLVTALTEDARKVEPTTERPAVAIEIREILGQPTQLAVQSVTWSAADDRYVVEDRGRPGGNYASWSDSRVGDNLRLHYPPGFYGGLAIHDRFDT